MLDEARASDTEGQHRATPRKLADERRRRSHEADAKLQQTRNNQSQCKSRLWSKPSQLQISYPPAVVWESPAGLASVPARSTDRAFCPPQGLGGRLAAGCAAAQPQPTPCSTTGRLGGCWKMATRRPTRPCPGRRCKNKRGCLRARKDREVQSRAPVNEDPAPPPPAPKET